MSVTSRGTDISVNETVLEDVSSAEMFVVSVPWGLGAVVPSVSTEESVNTAAESAVDSAEVAPCIKVTSVVNDVPGKV